MKHNKKSILLIVLIFGLILLSFVNAVWFNEDFDFRRNITIDEGLDLQLNNTPFLLNFSTLPENPNGFGEIIVVGSQSYQLPSEVVSTNEIWFNATTPLNGTAGLEIYYKKTGTNASFLPVQVWTNYIAELHFQKGPNAVLDLMVNNSANETGEGANFTASDDDAFTTDGLFGFGYQGDNTNNFVHLNSLNGDLVNKNLTFGMWFNATVNDLTISGKTLLFFQDTDEFSLRTTSNNISWRANGALPVNVSNVPIVPGTWQHIVITMTTDTGEMYLNGTKVADLTDDVFQGALNSNSNLGSDSKSTAFFNGRIDEFFIYDGILTAERINATFQMGMKNYAVLSGEEERGENITVLLESPNVNFFSSSSTVNFTCSANETNFVSLANVTFDLWDSTGAVEAETFRDLFEIGNGSTPYSTYSEANSVAFWTLNTTGIIDGNYTDFLGLNNVDCTNCPANVSSFLTGENASDFDGINDILINTTTLDPPIINVTVSNLTYSFWFKFGDLPEGSGNQRILDVGESHCTIPISNRLQCINAGTGDGSLISPILPSNVWQHGVYTFSSLTQEGELFIDGISVDNTVSNSGAPTNHTTITSIQIGNSIDASNIQFNGSIAHVAIFKSS